MFSFADDFELRTYICNHASMNSAHYTTLSDHSNKLTVVHTSHVRQKKTIVKEFDLEPEVRRMKYWIASRNVTQHCDLWASVCCVDVETSSSFYKTHARNESENSPLVSRVHSYIGSPQLTERRALSERNTERSAREKQLGSAVNQQNRKRSARGKQGREAHACSARLYSREKKGRVIFFLPVDGDVSLALELEMLSDSKERRCF